MGLRDSHLKPIAALLILRCRHKYLAWRRSENGRHTQRLDGHVFQDSLAGSVKSDRPDLRLCNVIPFQDEYVRRADVVSLIGNMAGGVADSGFDGFGGALSLDLKGEAPHTGRNGQVQRPHWPNEIHS